MTIQEVFNSDAVRQIEIQTLSSYYEIVNERRVEETEAIVRMLEVRKRILDKLFVMDDNYKSLLAEFNETLKQQLIEMRKRTIALHEAVTTVDYNENMVVTGMVRLGYEYSHLHPVQSMRAKKMWAILNGSLEDFTPLYEISGTGEFRIERTIGDIDSENRVLYLDESLDNWNEGLDRNMTDDMHLVYSFHELYNHMAFSIFDLLWVRDFCIDLRCEIDYNTSSQGIYGENLDWKAIDYFD